MAADIDPFKQRIFFSAPGMERIHPRSQSYSPAPGVDLPMKVYLPQRSKPGLPPVVVLIHGGPIAPEMSPPDWGVFESYGQLLAASGLAAVTFKHRFFGPEDYERSGADVAAALAQLRTRGAALGIDTERIALWGFSGGGSHLAIAFHDPPPYVRCVVSYYAILDLRTAPDGLRAKIAPGVLTSMSPAYLAAQAPDADHLPPVLVARAGLDDDWINAGIDAFVGAAMAKRLTLELLTHPKGKHGFDIFNDDDRTREIIKETLAFLEWHLGVR